MPDPSAVDPYKFEWGLKTPCNDCPFVKSTPLHDGIANDLLELAKRSEEANFLHSCHKTHPGADGWVENYTGPVQNCAGLSIMLTKADELTWPMVKAIMNKHLDPEALDKEVVTYDSIKDMAKHYVENHVKIRVLRSSRWKD